MGWDIFDNWGDLQFVNYTIAEEFEDGTIGFWRMEDWEIYGPGAGGYSSSGPYGNWQDDIRSWLDGGSMLARDIIQWDAGQLQTMNLSQATRQSVIFGSLTSFYMPVDSTPTFGPEGSGAEYDEGEIVVTAIRAHTDNSITYRFASYDPFTHQPVSWLENAGFLDQARSNADANTLRFDLAEGEAPLAQQELAAIEVVRTAIQDTLASLRQLDPRGYFEVEGWGRIRVSELITLFTFADYEVRPSSAFTLGDGTIGNVVRNDGDPRVGINRAWLPNLSVLPQTLNFFLVHEIVHVTRVGWRNRDDANAESMTNDVAAAILSQLGRQVSSSHVSGGTVVHYRPGTPTT